MKPAIDKICIFAFVLFLAPSLAAGKETLPLKTSPLARFLYNLPVVFKKLKFRESVLCD